MKFSPSISAACIALVCCAASPKSMAAEGHSISSVNGTVRAEPGQTYTTVSTVNGGVRVGSGATVETAKAVNGEIEIEHDAKVGEVSAVNGEVEIGEGAVIARDASTVNGSIKVEKRARVGGDVYTVSGEIELEGAEVGGTVSTHNGDIELTNGAHVRGGIRVKKNNNDSKWNWSDSHPEVHICATCVVDGDLNFERPVELHVEPGAKIGKVIGEVVKSK